VTNDGREVLFHRTYSTGTAAVMGDEPLAAGRHHYWELKMGRVYGTAVAVGVATSDFDVRSGENSFEPLLGDL